MGLISLSTLCFGVLAIVSGLPIAQLNHKGQGRDSQYPLFKQCDPLWGDDEMGTIGEGERSTICGEGCAMSCVAMGLAGNAILIDGKEATPKTLNSWLEGNNGYTCAGGDCNNLVLNAPERINSCVHLNGEDPDPSFDKVCNAVNAGGYLALLHVHNRHHFVLATSCDASSSLFQVNDPYYNTTSYTFDDVADVLSYTIDA